MKDKRSIPPKLRQFVPHLLRRAGDKAAEIGSQHMKATCGLSTREWGALHLIHDQPQSQQAVADAMGIDRTQMMHLADSLEKKSCLKRTSDPDDRRKHLLKITPKGLASYRAGLKAVETMNDELFTRLTADEVATLQDILLRILES